ncbi:formimidoylglutamate deiminase [Actinopolymorpha alba]|uniref:formimidoylglutamate deiminase n=1 Tax=Actinopolymorpha alba TaxID=533267 RepID=UPI000364E7B7|nr:formimidoylglutamate deiminase [Actinopolymorpha alba]
MTTTGATAYWCELAWVPPGEVASGVLVHVDDTHITAVERAATPPPRATRLPGLTLPGLANVHSHAFHRALRGRTHGVPTATGAGRGSFWTWRERMYDVARRLDPDTYHQLARAVYGEMVLAGITCVGEFHYLHHGPDGTPYDEPNVMAEVLVAAAREAGLRITVLDTCYLTGGIGAPLSGAQMRFGDGDAEKWATRADQLRGAHAKDHDVVVGAAVHSVRAVPPHELATVVSWGHASHAPLHVHLSEQRRENADCEAAYGVSPTALLFEHGVLGPRTTAVHATHLDEGGVGLLAGTETTVCLCPTTERDLADGIGPASSLSRAGSPLVLGSDSHAVIDLFEEARALELDERLHTEERGHWSAPELLTAMSESGHRALGFADAGLIAPGGWADLVSVRLDSVRTAGADLGRAVDMAVFAGTAADVVSVVASGCPVASNGHHLRLGDVGALLTSSIQTL